MPLIGYSRTMLSLVFVILLITKNEVSAATYVAPGIWQGGITYCTPTVYFEGTSPKDVADAYCDYVRGCDNLRLVPENGSRHFPPSIYLSTVSYYGSYYQYRFACTRLDGVVETNSQSTLTYAVDYRVSKISPNDKGNPGCSGTKKPIHIGNGNKFLKLEIVPKNLNYGLAFGIAYNSNIDDDKKSLGRAWRHSYDKSIQTELYTQINLITIVREDGKTYSLKLNGGAWLPSSDQTYRVTQVNDAQGILSGWIYNDDLSGDIETYSASGKLLVIQDRSGNTQSMSYSTVSTPVSIALAPDLLIQVTNHLGQSLKFTYDNVNRIKTMTNPAGGVYTYAYD
ncbi:MAG: hypothetical protein CTY35_15855, partial [Methylotenera sp.]